MDMKEKMQVIAHLGDHITYKENIGICYDSELAKVIEDAYMELKNGVTVQEWISVKDGLPKPFTPVLVYRQSFGTLPPYIKVDKMTLWSDDTQVWTDEVGNWKNVTTHWMPLPPAPKGE